MPATDQAAVHGGGAHGCVAYSGAQLRLGRHPGNDLVLDDPNVSRFHAVIEPHPGGVRVRDLDSRNGTRVDGTCVQVGPLHAGAEIGIGSFALTFTGKEVHARSMRGAVAVEAVGVSVTAQGRQILAPTHLEIRPGELVCIIGENGSGKSTLLRALAGAAEASSGRVLINGEPVSQRLTDVGYVPQDDTVHPWLTVEEALHYGAQLRLPEHTPAELDRAVEVVIEQLRLAERPAPNEPPLRERLIGSDDLPTPGKLSGGQRKRICVAMEMLARPSVMLLDEPTSPLDPLYAEELIKLLRGVTRSACSVVMVTHKIDDVALCDKVAVLARGGHLCFCGSPSEALRYFGVTEYRDIFGVLQRYPGEEWAERAGGEVPAARRSGSGKTRSVWVGAPAAVRRPPRLPRLARQSVILARRYARLLSRDRSNLIGSILSVPLISLLLLAFPRGVLQTPRAPTFLFVLVFVVSLLGMVASFRELVRERAIFRRERAAGVGVPAYLASKLMVLGCLGAVQAIALGSVAFACHPLERSGGDYAAALGVLVLASLSGIAMGLVISAAARSQEQATTLIAIPLVLQLLFAGSIIPLPGIEIPAALMAARWSFGALGRLAGLGIRRPPGGDLGAAFGAPVIVSVIILLTYAAGLSGVALWRLTRAR